MRKPVDARLCGHFRPPVGRATFGPIEVSVARMPRHRRTLGESRKDDWRLRDGEAAIQLIAYLRAVKLSRPLD